MDIKSQFIHASIRTRRFCLPSLILMPLLIAPVPGHADDDVVESRTVNGHKFELSQVGQGDYRVRVDGKELLRSGPPKAELSLEGVHTGDGKVYIVFSRASENCPARILAIDLSGMVPLVSKPMGNCSEQSQVEVVDGALRVTSPAKTGRPIVTTFLAGQTLTGPALSAPVQGQASSSDIFYPDLPEPGTRVVFQYTGENNPVEIMVKPGNLATLVLYNGQIAFRLRSEDYPGAVTVQGPITGPDALYDINKPLTVKKGSPAYVVIVAKTGASTCTQHGFIMDVTGAIPIVTSKLDLCSPEPPKVGMRPDGTVEILAKSWEPPGFGSIMRMPAEKYDFRTGDADYVKVNLPAEPAQSGGKRPVRR